MKRKRRAFSEKFKAKVAIERKGKPLAKIVPIEAESTSSLRGSSITPRQKMMLEELKSLPRVGIEENPVEILRAIRRNRVTSALDFYFCRMV